MQSIDGVDASSAGSVHESRCVLFTNIFHAECVGRRVVLAFVESVARVARVLPPLVVQQLDGALLLQLQDGQ